MCDMFKQWTIKGRNHDSAKEGRKQWESRNWKRVGTGRGNVNRKHKPYRRKKRKHQTTGKENILGGGGMDTSCGRVDYHLMH